MLFRREVREVKFLSPLQGFAPVVQRVEFRRDPLTGRWSRINLERARRVRQAMGGSPSDLLRESEEGCFFCPQNLERSTPKLPPEFGEERMRRGEAVLFPNLFPFAEFHAVVVLSEEHLPPLREFHPGRLRDAVSLSLEYFRRVGELEPSVKYGMLNWNHLPPAAASIVHPHFQLLVDRSPTFWLERILRTGREYRRKRGRNFWLELEKEERRRGERWIGEGEGISWFTSFAPTGQNEVWALFKEASCFGEVGEKEVEEFGEGLHRVLRGYEELGVETFNLTSFSGPEGGGSRKYHRLSFRLISRPPLRPLYTSDSGFMERFQYEPVVETLPEELAGRLRRFFGG
jgi:galactose-1-phosphate uridylyltransferase